MALLLDTHALLWWLAGSDRLSARAKAAIAEPTEDIWVSAASAWEITTKVRLGKLPGAAAVAHRLDRAIADQGFAPLAITFQHGSRAGALSGPHRDPFDRMLIAQALVTSAVLVSNETAFDAYGVARLW